MNACMDIISEAQSLPAKLPAASSVINTYPQLEIRNSQCRDSCSAPAYDKLESLYFMLAWFTTLSYFHSSAPQFYPPQRTASRRHIPSNVMERRGSTDLDTPAEDCIVVKLSPSDSNADSDHLSDEAPEEAFPEEKVSGIAFFVSRTPTTKRKTPEGVNFGGLGTVSIARGFRF